MTMALVDQLLSICCVSMCSGCDLTGIGTKAHGPALILDVFLLGHKVDHAMGRFIVEFCRSGSFKTSDITCELAHCCLQPEADP